MIAVRLAPSTSPAGLLARWSPLALDVEGATVVVSRVVAEPGAQIRNAPVDLLLTVSGLSVTGAEALPGWSVLATAATDLRAWTVTPHHQISWTRTWPDGTDAPGVKMVSFMRRAPDTTPEAFAEHWTRRHTPLARTHHPGLWNYTQNVVARSLTGAGSDIDGIAELHFRSRWSFEHEFFDSEAGRTVILADIPRFMAPPGRDGSLMIETPLRTAGI